MSVELLAPAGSYSKFLTALNFGADAVYLGGKQFSLRTFADNFTQEELQKAVALAHERAKKGTLRRIFLLETRILTP